MRSGGAVLAIGILSCWSGLAVAGPASAARASPAADERSLEELARSSVFELEIQYDPKTTVRDVRRRSRGFLVSSDGTAISSLGALRSAVQASARFDGDAVAHEVHFLGCDEKHDLALIRLAPKRSAKGGGGAGTDEAASPYPRALELGDESALFSEATWTLAGPGGSFRGGPLATDSLLSEQPDDEDSDAPRELVSSPYLALLPGSPIVCERGKLRGRWTLPRSGLEPEACVQGVAPIARLLAEHAGATPQPIRNEVTKRARSILGHELPSLEWGKPVLQRDVDASVKKLPSIACSKCAGTGAFDDGYYDVTPGRAKRWIPKPGPCPKCRGNRLEKADDVWRDLPALAERLSRADPAVRRSAARTIGDELAHLASLNARALAEAIEARSAGALDPGEAIAGQAVVCVLSASGVLPALPEGWGAEGRLFVDEDRSVRLILPTPSIDERAHASADRLLLGVVAGVVRDQGRDWVVVEHATVVGLAPRRK